MKAVIANNACVSMYGGKLEVHSSLILNSDEELQDKPVAYRRVTACFRC